jgi:hypothetical protein
MIHLHTKFHTPSSNGISYFHRTEKASENVSMVTILSFYVLQSHCLNRSHIFFHDLVFTSFQDLTVSASSVSPTSQVCMSTMLLLLIVGN